MNNMWTHFFSISKWSTDSNLFEFAIVVICNMWLVVLILAICEPGSKVTEQFEMFGGELAHCKWYSFPIELQQMYKSFLMVTQNPVKNHSFGGIACDRETAKRVQFDKFRENNVNWNSNFSLFIYFYRFSTQDIRTLCRFDSCMHRY